MIYYFLGAFAARMLDPIIAACGIASYFAMNTTQDWRRSLAVAVGAGFFVALLFALNFRTSIVGVIVSPLASATWWAIFYHGRRLLNEKGVG